MPGSRLPVMFWIFGGYFQAGNNAWWAYGPDNWVEREVVLVQPNHRLGPFGFTDLGIPEAPGNQVMMMMMMIVMIVVMMMMARGCGTWWRRWSGPTPTSRGSGETPRV